MARIQAGLVMNAVRERHPDLRMELVAMKTSGDRLLGRSLDAAGGKGLFVKELDDALRAGRVDICVHSYKDVPLPDDPDLPIVAVSRREDPRDILVLPAGQEAISFDKPLGSSSQRRRLQLAALFPEWRSEPIRGNVRTRLRKLDDGLYGALVLAAAGIKRLGLWHRAHRVFSPEEVLPAACQGMLAVQGRAGEDHGFLDAVEDADARIASLAERTFIAALGGGCSTPTAAFARVDGETVVLSGFVVAGDGRTIRDSLSGRRRDVYALGRTLADRIRRGSCSSG